MVIAEKITPILAKIIATIGIDINPALLPCEFTAIATSTTDETIVAIVDFFIIPIYKGRSPNKIEDIIITICIPISIKLNVTNERYLLTKNIQTY